MRSYIFAMFLMVFAMISEPTNAQEIEAEVAIQAFENNFNGTHEINDSRRRGMVADLVMTNYLDSDASAVRYVLSETSRSAYVCTEIARSFDVFMTAASNRPDLYYDRIRHMQRVHDRSDLACQQVQTRIVRLQASLDARRAVTACRRITLENWDAPTCMASNNMNMYGRYAGVLQELSAGELCYLVQSHRNRMVRQVARDEWALRTNGSNDRCPVVIASR